MNHEYQPKVLSEPERSRVKAAFDRIIVHQWVGKPKNNAPTRPETIVEAFNECASRFDTHNPRSPLSHPQIWALLQGSMKHSLQEWAHKINLANEQQVVDETRLIFHMEVVTYSQHLSLQPFSNEFREVICLFPTTQSARTLTIAKRLQRYPLGPGLAYRYRHTTKWLLMERTRHLLENGGGNLATLSELCRYALELLDADSIKQWFELVSEEHKIALWPTLKTVGERQIEKRSNSGAIRRVMVDCAKAYAMHQVQVKQSAHTL